jgi:hypothetical protein
MVVLFLGEEPSLCSITDVACLALIERWEDSDPGALAPRGSVLDVQRLVRPMVDIDGALEVCDGPGSYDGYYPREHALMRLGEHLQELWTERRASPAQ